jgi:hypothetical protein
LISLALTIMTCTLCRKFRNNQYRPEQLWQYERINLIDNLDLEEGYDESENE